MERLLLWKMAWCELLSGLIGVFTFGFYSPKWHYKVVVQLARHRSKKAGLIK
jgi:hypothetical protein